MLFEILTQPLMTITVTRKQFESGNDRSELARLIEALHPTYWAGTPTPDEILAWHNPQVDPDDWTHFHLTFEPLRGVSGQVNGHTFGTCFFSSH